jgi:arylsulfatase A-like enzyme
VPSAGYGPYDRALTLADHGLGRLLAGVDLGRTSLVVAGDHGERLEVDYRRNRDRGGAESDVLVEWHRFLAAHPPPVDYDAWFEHAREHLGEATARIYAHNVLGHGFHLTEELVRVPLVIVDPDRTRAGATDDSLRSQADWMATMLDLAGVDDERAPAGGVSLLDPAAPGTIYLEANGSGGKQFASRCYLRGARTRDWKYWRIEGSGEERRVLWNLADDPHETRDVAADHPERVSELDRFVDRRLAGSPAGRETALSPEEERRLEETLQELGYL